MTIGAGRRFMAAKVEREQGPMDALVAETLNYRKALRWMKESRFQRVIFESDSLLLVSAINNSVNYLFAVDLLINDCKELL